MSEGRIILLGTLPLIAGVVWLAVLRKPGATVHYEKAAERDTPSVAGRAPAADSPEGFPGVIVSGYSAEIGTEVSGSVAEVTAAVGARVREGDPLLRIGAGSSGEDLRMARAKLEQQRSAVARARAELAEASDLLQRLEAIESGVSERQLVAARAKEQQAQAALAEAQAGLGVFEADVGQQLSRTKKHVIRAPFDGVVVARLVDPGALVVAGQIVARVITEDYFVRFAMPAAQARLERAGSSVHVDVPGVSRPLTGVISDLQPEIDPAAQLVFARARLEVGEHERKVVLPGVRVRVMPAAARAGGG